MRLKSESGTTEVVYVRLRGEGTNDGYDPGDEDWEFKPGMLVRLESKRLEGQVVQVAVSLADASS